MKFVISFVLVTLSVVIIGCSSHKQLASQYKVINSTLKEPLYDKLVEEHIAPIEILNLVNECKPLIDFRKSRPEDNYAVYLNDNNQICKFIYSTSPLDKFIAVRVTGDEFSVYKDTVYINNRLESKEFIISSSLYQAIIDGGETDYLAMELMNIFAWDIDFVLFPRVGDKIKIIFEKKYNDNNFLKYGNILAAQYISPVKTYTAYRYSINNKTDYYDLNGHILRKMFLRMPLKAGVITSTFSNSRRHPVLGYTRAHTGIDYGAPYYSSLMATGDGIVKFVGWNGGYGKLVIIRHNNGYETYYGHCSRLLVRKGQNVKQGQRIALVGSTGLSTGPHVHYEIRRSRRPINPFLVKTSKGLPIPDKEKEKFNKKLNEYEEIFLNGVNSEDDIKINNWKLLIKNLLRKIKFSFLI